MLTYSAPAAGTSSAARDEHEGTDMNPLAAYDLSGRTAVITGAASGIGAETCELLAASGAAIVAADLNADGADATASKIRDSGGRAIAVATDVTKRADVATLVERAVAEFGKLDIMCNVAGAMFPGLIEDLDDDVIDKGIALNLKGVLYGTQYAIKAMKQSGGGSIVNVSSAAIDHPYAGIGVYAFTKAGVAMLTMTAALEAGPHGIRVNAIAPGTTVTPFTTWRLHKEDGSVDTEAMEQFLAQQRGMSPLDIVGEAADQAQLIHYLVSDAAKFATGNIFRVNGGQAMPW
jgi:3-oxoacyl-[acyl-carrier protein] reductase